LSRVYFRGSRAQARGIVNLCRMMITGRTPDVLGIGRGVFLTVGFAALSDIKADFVRKARGGTGEDGVKWPPLSPQTLAYHRRFGPGEKSRLKKAAGLGGTNRYAPGGKKGLLTAAQLKRWRFIYSRVLRRLMVSMNVEKWSLSSDAEIENSRFLGGESGAKGRAAQIAWATLKREGAKTMIDVFGHRNVEILRDTGVLLNSLSPGKLSGGGPDVIYQFPAGEGGEDQIFSTMANGVIVGTNVPYAATHQYGDAKRKIPARPFLPVGDAPQAWQDRWAEAGAQAMAIGIRKALEAA